MLWKGTETHHPTFSRGVQQILQKGFTTNRGPPRLQRKRNHLVWKGVESIMQTPPGQWKKKPVCACTGRNTLRSPPIFAEAESTQKLGFGP